jgi:hypothetical protein
MSSTSRDRRRELRSAYEQRQREAGVYALRNSVTGRVLVAASPDLPSVRNKLAFARDTGSTGVFDRRLIGDARAHGAASFTLEVLDRLEVTPGMTPQELAADLATLEALWDEKLRDVPRY